MWSGEEEGMNGEESDNAPTPRFEAFWGLQAGGRAESGQDGGVAVARATLRIRLDGLSKELVCLPPQDAVLR